MAAGPAPTMEQALLAMQQELATTRSQVQRMAQMHDLLRADHDNLRNVSDAALIAKTQEIRATEEKLQRLMFHQKFDLLDMKVMQPENFKGKQAESFKPWARKVKAFCNAKKQGFRKALEWSEKQTTEIYDLAPMGWEQAEAANEKRLPTTALLRRGTNPDRHPRTSGKRI